LEVSRRDILGDTAAPGFIKPTDVTTTVGSQTFYAADHWSHGPYVLEQHRSSALQIALWRIITIRSCAGGGRAGCGQPTTNRRRRDRLATFTAQPAVE
jgi:hypothetical protein